MSGFDLSREQIATARHDEGIVYHVCDPVTGEPAVCDDGSPVTITVAGRLSQRYRDAVIALDRGKKIRRSDDDETIAQAAEDRAARLVGACITGWHGLRLGDAPYEYSAKNAVELCRKSRRIRQDLYDLIHDDAGFFTPSSTG